MRWKDIASAAGGILLMAGVILSIYEVKKTDMFGTGESRNNQTEEGTGRAKLGDIAVSLNEITGWLEETMPERRACLSGKMILESGFQSADAGIEHENTETKERESGSTAASFLEEAEKLAAGYFYEEAIELLESAQEQHSGNEEIELAVQRYEKAAAELAEYKGIVAHISFQPLIADPEKAFDGDDMSDDYEKAAITIAEFEKILEEMYARGYILIDIRNLAAVKKDENGNAVYAPARPVVPAGKMPFVLSIDDVNYYEYTQDDGFGKRLALDENGDVKCVYEKDGEEILGDFDVIPVLDSFVEEHPDFSYRGAKGIISLTGFEGAFGYATNETESKTYIKDSEAVKTIASRLKGTGWQFASHGYWHQDAGKISLDALKLDTARWKTEVGSLIGETNIYVFPDGKEVEYPGEKLEYLKTEGYSIFCGLDEKTILHINLDYIRQTRRSISGAGITAKKSGLSDLFDTEEIGDPARKK